jgi:hypothetical protein
MPTSPSKQWEEFGADLRAGLAAEIQESMGELQRAISFVFLGRDPIGQAALTTRINIPTELPPKKIRKPRAKKPKAILKTTLTKTAWDHILENSNE